MYHRQRSVSLTYDLFPFSSSVSNIQEGFVLKTLTISQAVMWCNNTGTGKHDLDLLVAVDKTLENNLNLYLSTVLSS